MANAVVPQERSEHTDIAAVLVAVLVVATAPLTTPGEYGPINTIIAMVVLVVLVASVGAAYVRADWLKRFALTAVLWVILTVAIAWPVQQFWVFPRMNALERPPQEATWTYCNNQTQLPDRARPDWAAHCDMPLQDPFTAKGREDEMESDLGGEANPGAAIVAGIMSAVALTASYRRELRDLWRKPKDKATHLSDLQTRANELGFDLTTILDLRYRPRRYMLRPSGGQDLPVNLNDLDSVETVLGYLKLGGQREQGHRDA